MICKQRFKQQTQTNLKSNKEFISINNFVSNHKSTKITVIMALKTFRMKEKTRLAWNEQKSWKSYKNDRNGSNINENDIKSKKNDSKSDWNDSNDSKLIVVILESTETTINP